MVQPDRTSPTARMVVELPSWWATSVVEPHGRSSVRRLSTTRPEISKPMVRLGSCVTSSAGLSLSKSAEERDLSMAAKPMLASSNCASACNVPTWYGTFTAFTQRCKPVISARVPNGYSIIECPHFPSVADSAAPDAAERDGNVVLGQSTGDNSSLKCQVPSSSTTRCRRPATTSWRKAFHSDSS